MRAALAILTLILLLTGCWDMKEAQDINFVTALGVDYVNGRYVIYAQLLDFAEIAKQEGKVETGSAKIWIGKGEGKTVTDAMNSVYPASQQMTLWTHVRAIVFSKALLDNRLPEAINGLIRSRDLRYTPWVYGTDKEIPIIFSSISLLNESALNSELLDPEEIFKQYSFMEPLRIIKLMNGVKEPATTTLLPLISYTDKVWKGNGEPVPQVKLAGAYAIAQGSNRGRVDPIMLQGARYVSFKRFDKFPLTLMLDDETAVALSIIHSDPKVRFDARGTPPSVQIQVRVKTYITEAGSADEANAEKIRMLAKKQIEAEIRRSFTAAKAHNIDLFNLEEKLYRNDLARWKQLHSQGKPFISLVDFGEVNVQVEISHASSYKVQNH
ncbi:MULTISPECIES: Ger(x)C family spore germination protein [Paenibacillus]|uniref:Ger(x)C family spore germination protein n=1 Tax=Paenibacillus TaxID=44249 RepID=UPI00073E853F|nr:MULTISPECIES: Ger(x)C family spore germination protein [Paenibacillus]MDU4698606.1 Ger(x)C family spore germination protein [Paenibacillus sp.]